MANFYYQNNYMIFMNFVYYTVITASDFMKTVITAHFGSAWVWQIGTNLFNFAFNFY